MHKFKTHITVSMVLLVSSFFGMSFANNRNVTISPGFWPDPISRSYSSGGTMDASTYNSSNKSSDSCRGYINGQQPDHVLTLNRDFDYLRIYVNSAYDTTMVILTSRGSAYCYDDQYGLDPMVQGDWGAGTYYIYIGTYGERGAYYPYTIYFTEFRED